MVCLHSAPPVQFTVSVSNGLVWHHRKQLVSVDIGEIKLC